MSKMYVMIGAPGCGKSTYIKNHIKEHKSYTSDGTATLNDVAYAISDGLKPVEITVLRKGKEIKLEPVYPNEKGIYV